MYRFFVNQREENYFILNDEIVNHLKSVRIQKEEKIICVYQAKFYICSYDWKNKIALIEQELDEDHEYSNNLILCASIIKLKRFEWLIQKATELGVKEFYPIITKNTNIKYIQQFDSKFERMETIIKNASEQSFRNILMKIHKPITFDEALKLNVKTKILAHEKSYVKSSNDFEGDICFYVGPEGGFTQEEIEKSLNQGIQIISLGKRILRSETASIYLLSRIKD